MPSAHEDERCFFPAATADLFLLKGQSSLVTRQDDKLPCHAPRGKKHPFPAAAAKFPARMRREFTRKCLIQRRILARKRVQIPVTAQKFPAKSRFAGNFLVETGSLITACTTTHSAALESLARLTRVGDFPKT